MKMHIDINTNPIPVNVHPSNDPIPYEVGERFIKGDKGDTGEKGEQGEKGEPFRYEDFTPEQLASLKGEKGDAGKDGQNGRDGYTPRKNIDYFDGKDGKDGQNGRDGYTPQKNVDYFDGKDGKDGSDYTITSNDYQEIAKLVPVPSPSVISETDINDICKPAFKGYSITFASGGRFENETLYIGLIDGTTLTKTKSSDYVGKVEKVEWIACESSYVVFDKDYSLHRIWETIDRGVQEYSSIMGNGFRDRFYLQSDVTITNVEGD